MKKIESIKMFAYGYHGLDNESVTEIVEKINDLIDNQNEIIDQLNKSSAPEQYEWKKTVEEADNFEIKSHHNRKKDFWYFFEKDVIELCEKYKIAIDLMKNEIERLNEIIKGE